MLLNRLQNSDQTNQHYELAQHTLASNMQIFMIWFFDFHEIGEQKVFPSTFETCIFDLSPEGKCETRKKNMIHINIDPKKFDTNIESI